MKAKEVVAKIDALKPVAGELPGQFADRQAGVLLDCGLEKFKANVAARFPSSKAKLSSIVSLRKEFSQWGEAIVRIGKFSWMRPTVGTHAFDLILREVEQKATGGEVIVGTVKKIAADPSTLRSGL